MKKSLSYILLLLIAAWIVFLFVPVLAVDPVIEDTTMTFEVISCTPPAEVKVVCSPTPAPTLTPSPRPQFKISISQDEIDVAAKMMWGESRGDSDERCAATLWVALNRKDNHHWPDDLIKVIEQPNQFTGYSKDNEITSHFTWLARDILIRYELEKLGVEEVGRTIPNDYFFFASSTGKNRFRKKYDDHSSHWDFSLPNPYEEEIFISFDYVVEIN